MDPDAAYDDMTEAHRAEQHAEAKDAALNLIRWLNRGGFPPAEMTRAEARSVASLVYQDARQCLIEKRRTRQSRRAR